MTRSAYREAELDSWRRVALIDSTACVAWVRRFEGARGLKLLWGEQVERRRGLFFGPTCKTGVKELLGVPEKSWGLMACPEV